VSPPAGPPRETVCSGFLTATEVEHLRVRSGTFCSLFGGVLVRGNAVAEPGSSLSLGTGTRVLGNVEVKSGASTGAVQTTVEGNFECDRCDFNVAFDLIVHGNLRIVGSREGLAITWSAIGGNLEIVETVPRSFGVRLADTTIEGNARIENNGGTLQVLTNTIGGNLELARNRVAPLPCAPGPCPLSEHDVFHNVVHGNMQVNENSGPLEVGFNTIAGNLSCAANDPPPVVTGNTARKREGQCAGP
jgi:hypothetical protein